jgi:hypothetical protein
MRWRRLLSLVMIPIALASWVAAAGRARRPYDGDRRLLRSVELKPGVGPPVTVWVSRLADATGLPLVCDTRLRLRPAAMAPPQSARAVDLLEALEEATGGKWLLRARVRARGDPGDLALLLEARPRGRG